MQWSKIGLENKRKNQFYVRSQYREGQWEYLQRMLFDKLDVKMYYYIHILFKIMGQRYTIRWLLENKKN